MNEINKYFLDTNILMYLHSNTDLDKKITVEELLNKNNDFFISTQILFEFIRAMNKKYKIEFEVIKKLVNEFLEAFDLLIITDSTLKLAIDIALKYKYSFTDSLVVAVAIENKCTILFSEDMHHGQKIENSLTIINPFMANIK